MGKHSAPGSGCVTVLTVPALIVGLPIIRTIYVRRLARRYGIDLRRGAARPGRAG